MAKVDLGRIIDLQLKQGTVRNGNNDLGSLGTGTFVCVPVYPFTINQYNLSCSTNSSNHLIVNSNGYSGPVIIMCFILN